MRSLSSLCLIKSAITGQRVSPENRFATVNRALKGEYSAKTSDRVEDLYCAVPRLLRQPRPILQHLANSGLRLGDGSDKTESVFGREITLRTGVFCNHGATQRQKSRSAIADPARAPCHVDALNRRELGKRASEVAAVRPRSAGDTVRVGDLPTEPAQPFPFRIIRSDVHCELKPRLGHAGWK